MKAISWKTDINLVDPVQFPKRSFLPLPDIVIQAENLGKHYPTGHQAEHGRDVALRAQGRALRNPAREI